MKVTAGGPLDRLQHVEATMLHMADVLDTIVEHIQKDPSARHLFQDEDEKSETPTIIIDQQKDDQTSTDEDVTMRQRDSSGVKRLHSDNKSPQRSRQITSDETEFQSTPQKSPPPKRERSTKEPSADPDHDRERGET
jgi:predicted DNA binding protein